MIVVIGDGYMYSTEDSNMMLLKIGSLVFKNFSPEVSLVCDSLRFCYSRNVFEGVDSALSLVDSAMRVNWKNQ